MTDPNDRHGYSQPTLAQYDAVVAQRDELQRRIDRVIAFRNDALDTSQSPWLGREIVSALDAALEVFSS